MTTGWPPGLLQDDERKLSRWLASRPDALYQLRKNMKQEDIIRMAREAGFAASWSEAAGEALERFAALVRADEREKLVVWMMAQGYATGHGETMEGLLEELRWQVRESEREACAALCDQLSDSSRDLRFGAAVRARGQA
jgi:hypothetical protein